MSDYPFFLSDVPSPPSYGGLDNVKQDILNKYLKNSQKIQSQINGIPIERDKIENFWKRWNSENANSLASKISNVYDFMNSNPITGAGFGLYDEIVDLPDSEKCSNLLMQLDQRINSWIDILKKIEPDFKEGILIDCIKNGKPIPQEFALKNGDGFSLGGNGLDISNKVHKAMQSLSKAYGILSNGKKSGMPLPEDFVGTVRNLLNSIGGEYIGEAVTRHGSNNVVKERNEKIYIPIENTFASYGFTLGHRTADVGNAKLNGKQIKPDYAVLYGEGYISFIAHGSIKTYQSSSNIKTVGDNKVLGGQLSYEASLKELLAKANGLNANSSAAFKGALSAILRQKGIKDGGGYVENDDINEYTNSFQTMKDKTKYLVFYDKFFGNGLKADNNVFNHVDFLVVNGIARSTYSILSEAINNSSLIRFSGAGEAAVLKRYGMSAIGRFVSTNKKKSYSGVGEEKAARIQACNTTWNNLCNKKIRMSINLGGFQGIS